MKLSVLKCVLILVLIPCLVLAEKESSLAKNGSQKSKNGTSDGRTIIKKVGCSGGGSSNPLDIFSGLGNIIPEISSIFNISSLMLPNLNLNSLDVGGSDKFSLLDFNKGAVPLFFAVAAITSLVVIIITLLVPKFATSDSTIGNMMDTLYNFMQDAISNGNTQYGAPLDQYQAPGDSYSHSSSGYPASGYSATQQDPSPSYGAPQAADSGYNNAPSSTYTDPSQSYGTPNRRYNYNYAQPTHQKRQPNYPSLPSNYLRSEKSKKK